MAWQKRAVSVATLVLGAMVAVTAPAAPPAGSAQAPARVVDVGGRQLVVQGAAVASFLPRMPVWILEQDAGGRPGLLIAEGTVVSLLGDRALVEVAEQDAGLLRVGALVEPRYLAEARMYRATLPDAGRSDAGRSEAAVAKAEPEVRARHRTPGSVPWGGKAWIDAVIEGPADTGFLLYRLGDAGPYIELALEAKGDRLHGVFLPVGETDPSIRVVQYYLVAAGAGTRHLVAGNPADPLTIAIDSVPERQEETLVSHGPVDRASHRKPLLLSAEINKRFSKPTIFYRARGSGSYRALPMRQAGPELYEAEIPARDVVAPGLAYYIAVMDEKGIVRDGFGSNRSPQTVAVLQPQILSSEENRNQLSLRYSYADFGTRHDNYHQVEAGLERLFFGFLIARLGGDVVSGRVVRLDVTSVDSPQLTSTELNLYRGRAGLDVHMGDYVSLSSDVAMAIFSGGSGLGYRVGARVGDEQVASIDVSLENVWDLQSDASVIDVLRVALSTPISDSWRLAATAVQESVLQAPGADSGLRLMIGLEVDLGASAVVEAMGGMSGRTGDAVGGTAGGGTRLKF